MKRSTAEESAELIHHTDWSSPFRSNVLITLVNAENVWVPCTVFEQCDHCLAQCSLSTVVGRRNARIVQEAQQVPTVVVPAQFVLQPIVVRIRHRTVAEMIAQLSLQRLDLHFKVLSFSSVICLPQLHRPR